MLQASRKMSCVHHDMTPWRHVMLVQPPHPSGQVHPKLVLTYPCSTQRFRVDV